jgi:hypothetical protein
MGARWCGVVLLIFGAVASRAQTASATNHPFPGLSWHLEQRLQPPMRWFVAEVELTNSAVHLSVAPGGPDPDGPGPWQTTLLPPTRIAAREGFDLVINGDFFDARGVNDAEGANSHYRANLWGRVMGPAMSDGKVWATCSSNRPCLVVHTNGHVAIEMLACPTADDWQVIAGNTMLVTNGVPLPHRNTARHPRTAVGLDAGATRLIILLVEGRRANVAVGMSYDELAAEMLRQGCKQALNLDGGGSSVLAIRDPGASAYQILNWPTDGQERAVANVLGIYFRAATQDRK